MRISPPPALQKHLKIFETVKNTVVGRGRSLAVGMFFGIFLLIMMHANQMIVDEKVLMSKHSFC